MIASSEVSFGGKIEITGDHIKIKTGSVINVTGKTGGELSIYNELAIKVPSCDTAIIQQAHIIKHGGRRRPAAAQTVNSIDFVTSLEEVQYPNLRDLVLKSLFVQI